MKTKALMGFGAVCLCLIFQAARLHAANEDIVLYAADATVLRGHWTRAADSSAAGGQVLATPDTGWSNTIDALASPANFAEFTFNAAGNTSYRVWVRIRAGGNSKYNDSIFVQFSDAIDVAGSPLY